MPISMCPDQMAEIQVTHQGTCAVPEKYPYLTLKKNFGGGGGSQKLKILKLSHQLSKEVGVGDS